jgi:hypothetical protein
MVGGMEGRRFQRNIEDFTCEHCGFAVRGDGYTNHCPKCLWSKHVDVNPGDRASSCGGLMKPVFVETERGEYLLVHQCEKCRYKKRNKTVPSDDFDEIVRISKMVAEK